MTRIYISGKITGIELEAERLFKEAELELIEKGYDPVNPFDLNHEHDESWASYMKENIKALCDCDAIFMLTNWKDSRGAIIEHDIATHLEMDIHHQHKMISHG